MKGQVFFATILFVVVGNIQADAVVPAYVVTEQGVTCSDDDMSDIDHSSECQIAITEIQDEIPGASFSGEVDYANNPPGCYYTSSVFWNANSQGVAGNDCSSCRSICKSSEYIYKEVTFCPRGKEMVKYSTLSLAAQACSANVACTALTDYRCNGGFWTCKASNLISKATNTNTQSCSWLKDFCNGEPCSPHGTCSVDDGDTIDGYLCTCDLGYTGNNCENDPCFEKTCSSHGTCTVDDAHVDAADGKLCTCDLGYTGNDCETEWEYNEIHRYAYDIIQTPCTPELLFDIEEFLVKWADITWQYMTDAMQVKADSCGFDWDDEI